jgi:hypothetical protein
MFIDLFDLLPVRAAALPAAPGQLLLVRTAVGPPDSATRHRRRRAGRPTPLMLLIGRGAANGCAVTALTVGVSAGAGPGTPAA